MRRFVRLGVVIGALAAVAAAPADELLRYVPTDIGFCVVVRDLREHRTALANSPFVAGLRGTALGGLLAQVGELDNLVKARRHLQKHLGADWGQLGDDVFGDGLVFAYRPGPPDQADREEGLFLIRARAAKPLADLIDRLNSWQKDTGELKGLEERSYLGVPYVHRIEKDRPTFYYLRGPILIVSGQEEMLKRALETARALPTDAEPALVKQLRALGVDRAFLSVYLNPRAFDVALAEKAKSAEGVDAAVLRTFTTYWKALDGAAVALTLDRELVVSAAALARTASLPSAARQLLKEAAKPSDLWQALPDNVLIAVAGRLDLAALAEAVAEFMPPEKRMSFAGDLNRVLGGPLGKDFLKEVLPCLGPDFGLALLAPAANGKDWFPQALVALRVASGDPANPVDRAVLAAVHSAAVFAVLANNGKSPEHPLSLKSMTDEKREIRYLAGEGVFPPGVQPAFGLLKGYLVVGSSPEALKRLNGGAKAVPSAESTPLLRINLKECRTYLKDRAEVLAQAIAEKDGLKPADVRGQLDGIIGTLQLFDALELTHRSGPGQLTLSLTLRTAQPLRK